MSEDQDVVTLVRARNGIEARVILAVLEEAGIPAYIPGSQLTDEYAMSQQLLSGGAVEVTVPRAAQEAARAALAAARAAGRDLPEEPEPPEESRPC